MTVRPFSKLSFFGSNSHVTRFTTGRSIGARMLADADLDALEVAMNAWADDAVLLPTAGNHTDASRQMVSSPVAALISGYAARTEKQSATMFSGAPQTQLNSGDDDDDLTEYVASRAHTNQTKKHTSVQGPAQLKTGSRRRVVLPTQETSKKARVFGYQEPTLFERRKPAPRLPPLEERHRPGGWDSSLVTPERDRGRRSAPLMPAPLAPAKEVHRNVLSAPSKDSKLRDSTRLQRPTEAPVMAKRGAAATTIPASCAPTTTTSHRDFARQDSEVPPVTERTLEPAGTDHHDADAEEQRRLQSDLAVKLSVVQSIRAEKGLLSKRHLEVEQELSRVAPEVGRLKEVLGGLEKRCLKAKDRKKELGQLSAAKRTKESRLHDMRNMLRQCRKRLEELKMLAAPSAEVTGTVPEVPMLPPINRGALSNSTADQQPISNLKEIQQLKAQYERFAERSKKLAAAKAKLTSSLKNVEVKQQVELDKLTKQRQQVITELSKRAKMEFEQAKQHLISNHEKGMHHRHRDATGQTDVETKRMMELSTQATEIQVHIRQISKNVAELASTESALRVHLRDYEARCIEAQSALDTARIRHRDATRNQVAAQKRLDGLLEEKRYLTEQLSDPTAIAAVQAVHDSERRAVLDAIAEAQAAQHQVLQRIASVEEALAKGSAAGGTRHPAADAAKPPQKFISELRLRIERAEQDCTRVQKQIETADMELEQKRRDHAKTLRQQQLQHDRTIEELTKELSSLKDKAKVLAKENVQLESQLDLAERMIAMNNLRKR